jgi:hypothetical protein
MQADDELPQDLSAASHRSVSRIRAELSRLENWMARTGELRSRFSDSATEYCDLCQHPCSLRQIHFTGKEFICPACLHHGPDVAP